MSRGSVENMSEQEKDRIRAQVLAVVEEVGRMVGSSAVVREPTGCFVPQAQWADVMRRSA